MTQKEILESLVGKIDKMYVLLIGNGKPEESIVFRLLQLEKMVESQLNKCSEIQKDKVDDGDERRKTWYHRMPPSKKILVSIGVMGFLLTYAVQIYHVASGLLETFLSMPK